ncbi:MAG: beta-propeller domain-containing protein, partial [Acidimicrobiales bacterium]|nr:beta-propeller domain-containing protein [Acidimicrobiales bacterium]
MDPRSGVDRSESYVTVLREQDGALAQIGQVGGLGKGEQIRAVRFIDDVGYV